MQQRKVPLQGSNVPMPLHLQEGLWCTRNPRGFLGLSGTPTVPRTVGGLPACSMREPYLFPEAAF